MGRYVKLILCGRAIENLKKGMGLVRGYVIPCERRHAKRHVLGESLVRGYVNLCERRHVKGHVLGERMNEFSVEKSY